MSVNFLSSNRFWALVIGAVILYLQSKSYIGAAETALIETILGGFIGIRTVDRFAEKAGSADTK